MCAFFDSPASFRLLVFVTSFLAPLRFALPTFFRLISKCFCCCCVREKVSKIEKKNSK